LLFPTYSIPMVLDPSQTGAVETVVPQEVVEVEGVFQLENNLIVLGRKFGQTCL
jgi:hypothetical protein